MSSLAYLIKQTQHLIRRKMDESLRPLGITVPGYAVLSGLSAEPGASNAALARRSFVTPQAMQTIVAGLERDGLISRTPDPTHGRRLKASLTASGARTLEGAHAAVEAVESCLRDAVRPASYEDAVAMLERCRDSLEA